MMESLFTHDVYYSGWQSGHQDDRYVYIEEPFTDLLGLQSAETHTHGSFDAGSNIEAAFDGFHQAFSDLDGPSAEFAAIWAGEVGELPRNYAEGPAIATQENCSLDDSQLSPPLTIISNHDSQIGRAIANSGFVQDLGAPVQHIPGRRQQRRQNHACDPCRVSKKACDLPRGIATRNRKPTTPCSACKIRGSECTVSWLASRKPLKHHASVPVEPAEETVGSGSAGSTATSNVSDSVYAALASISALETELSRRLIADRTCSLQFGLYVDISDSFLSQCLLEGSMPPFYKCGIAAYETLSTSVQLSTYIKRAEEWVASCWKNPTDQTRGPLPKTEGPCLFRAVSVLDALLGPPYASSRDAAITETYKWVAIASAAQFANGDYAESMDGSPENTGTSRDRDIALVSWRKAKAMVLGNMSATRSFRLALSLVIFGNITPPQTMSVDSPAEQDTEDASYAFCEGIKRLRRLCSQARNGIAAPNNTASAKATASPKLGAHQQHILNLAADVLESIRELVGALEWLVSLYNAVAIGTSYGKTCPFPPELEDDEAGDGPVLQSPTPVSMTDVDISSLSVAQPHQRQVEDSIMTRARQDGQPFTEFWRRNTHDDESVLHSGRLSVSLSIVVWRALARFTLAADMVRKDYTKANYGDIDRHYVAMAALIELWRRCFGSFDQKTRSSLLQSQRQVWRMCSFSSVDTDLAILLFCDVAQRLETSLAELPPTHIPAAERLCCSLRSTKVYRSKQRLVSAMQVAIISSTSQVPASATAAPGCKSDLPVYARRMCAHPVSTSPSFPQKH